MLSVALTLCAILAVIWWLTGTNRSQQTDDGDLQTEVVADALERLAVPGRGITRADGGPVGDVLYDTLVGVGMDPGEASATVAGLGYPAPERRDESIDRSGGLSVLSMKDEHARAALERALLVGVQLARMDDDYAGVSDDAQTFDALRQRADEAEAVLFDDHRRSLLDFYSRAVLVLQDSIQAETDDTKRDAIRVVLTRFDEELVSLQEEMDRAMADLPDDPDTLAWGDSEDRRRYYFKMGVTNSLRRSGHLSSLGSLYRFRGVNYDVEEAYQLAGEEEPLLLRAANLDFRTLVSLGAPDVRRMTTGRTPGRSIPNTES